MTKVLTLVSSKRIERTEEFHSIPVEAVLTDAGENLQAIADVLRDEMGLCLPDPRALSDAMPLVLFKECQLVTAMELSRKITRAGGQLEIGQVRERYLGVRKPFNAGKKQRARAAA